MRTPVGCCITIVTLRYKVSSRFLLFSVVMLCWLALFFALVGAGEKDDLLFFGTLLVAPFVTIICYAAYVVLKPPARRPWHPIALAIKHVGVACVLAAASGFGAFAAHWIFWDWIGCPDQTIRGSTLQTVHLIANHEGDVIVTGRSICEVGLLAGSDAQYYFVFVHRRGQPNTTYTLALRYDTDDSGWKQPPQLEWLDEKTVRVTTVSRVYAVTQERPRVEGIRIVYRFRRSDYVTNITPWQRVFTRQI